jgi:predicted RNase H-like HicB family nuclease
MICQTAVSCRFSLAVRKNHSKQKRHLLQCGAPAIDCCSMHNEFTAIIERDGDWFIAQCPEVPEANGQGRTPDEAKSDLAAAIQLVLEDRREDALKAASSDALRDVVTVGS